MGQLTVQRFDDVTSANTENQYFLTHFWLNDALHHGIYLAEWTIPIEEFERNHLVEL